MKKVKREGEKEKEFFVCCCFDFFPRVCVSLFCFYNSIFIFFTSISRGPKGLDGAGGDPGEVAEGAGRGAEGPGVDRGEAPVLFVFSGFFLSR